MVHKRKDRPNEGFRVWPTLPDPWGRVGPWQTGLTRRAQAEQVEAWLHEMARTRPEVVDALVAKTFSLETAWVAKLRGTLDALLAGVNDPLVVDAANDLRKSVQDERVLSGLKQIEKYVPHSTRLSALRGGVVEQMYRDAMADGRKPNSVRRSLHRATSELLRSKLGSKARDEAFIDVVVPEEDDTREVQISPEEMRKLITSFQPVFFDVPIIAMLCAIDRGPILRIAPRFFDEERGLLRVLDRKTSKRPRTIELSSPAWAILRRRCAGKGIDEPAFDFTEDQIRHYWEAARDRAAGVPSRNAGHRGQTHDDERRLGARSTALTLLARQGIVTLPVLRFKDLRHMLPTAWNALGLPAEDLKPIMGWAKNSNMSERYTTARIEGDRKSLDAVAAYLGLERIHLHAMGA